MGTSGSTVYRFGPFEVHPASGVLLKEGRRIKLQDQPFRLLFVLVENAQEVVGREEIQRQIWSGNTFVDFDSGLRVAVRKLREALGDDADDPQYIETIPKRGYRLRVAVVRVPDTPAGFAPTRLDEPASALPISPRAPGPATRPLRLVAATLALVVVAIGATALFSSRNRERLSDRDTVVLADFANSTSDPVFDGALRQGLTVALEQSPFLSLVSDERIHQTLRLMGRDGDSRLTPEVASDLCKRIGSDAVLDGSIAAVGTAYVVGLRATSCHTGAVLDQEQVQAARKEEIFQALDQIAGRFRTRVGESLTTIQARGVSLAEATTPSLDALKAYSTGWKAAFADGEASSIPFFRRALEYDDKFAMAYASLAVMYGTTGESALAAQSSRKAYELRDRASDRERFFIAAYYDGRSTGNEEMALQTCQTWAQAYPRDMVPHAFLSGFVYPVLGKYDLALKEGQRAIELSPDAAFAYGSLADIYRYLNRFDDAEATLRTALERKVEVPSFAVARFDYAFLKGDRVAMDRVAASPDRDASVDDWLAQHQAFVQAGAGHLGEATATLQRAISLALQGNHRERAALFRTPIALWHALFGDLAGARRGAAGPFELATNREVEYGVALAFAISGDSGRAEALARGLEQRFPDDTSVKFSYLPTIRAAISLGRGEPSSALEQLQAAIPYELGTPRSYIQGFFGALYPVYGRGQVYLASGNGSAAAGEFQKIIDHPGIAGSDPIWALAQVGLARARALEGDRLGAKAAYERFLALWHDADSDIPILRQARAEYARY